MALDKNKLDLVIQLDISIDQICINVCAKNYIYETIKRPIRRSFKSADKCRQDLHVLFGK